MSVSVSVSVRLLVEEKTLAKQRRRIKDEKINGLQLWPTGGDDGGNNGTIRMEIESSGRERNSNNNN